MKMNEKMISVVIPVYNSENTLKRCLESVIRQTHEDLQIILVDDGSTDSSYDICKEYSIKDKRIEIYRNENSGSVRARKNGILSARGQYVGFVDSDDYVEENMFEELYKRIVETKADFVHCGLWHESEGGEYFSEELNFTQDIIDTSKNAFDIICNKTNVFVDKECDYITNSLVTKLFKRELITKTFLELDDEQQLGEDGANLILSIYECRRYATLRKCLYHYVHREDSLSFVNENGNLMKYSGMYKEYEHIFDEYGDRAVAKPFLDNMLRRLIYYYFFRYSQVYVEQYRVNEIEDYFGKNIAIYGAGVVGKNYYTQFARYKQINVVAWVDRNYQERNKEIRYFEINDPKYLLQCDFDFVLIALSNRDSAQTVMNMLVNLGVNKKLLVWHEPNDLVFGNNLVW